MAERRKGKLGLIYRLYERKLDPEDLRHWYRYLDWLLPLPKDVDDDLWKEIRARDQEKEMPYITTAERYGMERGLEQGLEKGLRQSVETVLRVRFGGEGDALAAQLGSVTDPARLQAILEAALRATVLDDVRPLLAAP